MEQMKMLKEVIGVEQEMMKQRQTKKPENPNMHLPERRMASKP